MRMHNTYSVLYNEMVFNLLKDRFGDGEAVVFARSSIQRFPIHWGGDCESTWEAMAEAMRGALSLTVSGFGYASHDIGGFEVCENCSVRNQRKIIGEIGSPIIRDISTMGRIWSFLISFKVAWILVVPSSLELWRRCCEEYG